VVRRLIGADDRLGRQTPFRLGQERPSRVAASSWRLDSQPVDTGAPFEGTSEFQRLVVARALSGVHVQ
jgi:hypothetical protein